MERKNVKERNCAIPITNTSKIVYNKLVTEIEKAQKTKKQRKWVIYGAGVRGNLLALLMSEAGEDNYCFCDKNEYFLDKEINGHCFISLVELLEKYKEFFVFISPENSKEIQNEFAKHGMKKNFDYVCLGGELYTTFINNLTKIQNDEVLILGDCDMLACSLLENERVCLADMLEDRFQLENVSYNQLLLSAMTCGGFYWTYNVYKRLGNNAKQVFITVDMRNFNGKTHCLPSTQHVDLLESMEKLVFVDGFRKFIESAKERYYGNQVIDMGRKAQGIDENSQIANRNYIWLNYCYKLKESNEELTFLCKLLEKIRCDGGKPIVVFMPMNYEKADSLCPKRFVQAFTENKKILLKIIERYNPYILDLSFQMDQDFFPQKDTYDECLGIKGKKIVANEIYEMYTKVRKEDNYE